MVTLVHRSCFLNHLFPVDISAGPLQVGKMAVRSALEPPPQPQLGSPNMKIFSLPIKMSFWLNEYFIPIKLREGV